MNSNLRRNMISSLVFLLAVFMNIDGATLHRGCHSRARTPQHGSSVLIDHDSQTSTYAISCRRGFVLVGPKTVICSQGQIVGPVSRCLLSTNVKGQKDHLSSNTLRKKRQSNVATTENKNKNKHLMSQQKIRMGKSVNDETLRKRGKEGEKNKRNGQKQQRKNKAESDYSEPAGEGDEIDVSSDYNDLYRDRYDYKTDYEDVDYSYDNDKKDEVPEETGADADYGDNYDYNYDENGGGANSNKKKEPVYDTDVYDEKQTNGRNKNKSRTKAKVDHSTADYDTEKEEPIYSEEENLEEREREESSDVEEENPHTREEQTNTETEKTSSEDVATEEESENEIEDKELKNKHDISSAKREEQTENKSTEVVEEEETEEEIQEESNEVNEVKEEEKTKEENKQTEREENTNIDSEDNTETEEIEEGEEEEEENEQKEHIKTERHNDNKEETERKEETDTKEEQESESEDYENYEGEEETNGNENDEKVVSDVSEDIKRNGVENKQEPGKTDAETEKKDEEGEEEEDGSQETKNPDTSQDVQDKDGKEQVISYNEDGELDIEYVDAKSEKDENNHQDVKHSSTVKESGAIPIDDEDDEDYSEGSGSHPRTSSSTTPTTTTTITTTTSTRTTTTSAPSTTHRSHHPAPMITDDEDLLEEGSGNFQELGSGSEDNEPTPVRSHSPSEIEKVRKAFSEQFGVDLVRLDTSCVHRFVEAPKIKHATMQGYDHQIANEALPGELYAEVLYICDTGFKLSDLKIDRLFCSEGDWIGHRPKCVEVVTKDPRPVCPSSLTTKCDHLCFIDVHGRPLCECHPGYELGGDGQTCVDVDECSFLNGGCDQMCINKPGTFMCDCKPGFNIFAKDRCIDINECLLNNGHGPCQDVCINKHGGYECSCENLPGTVLSADNHTCEDTNGCTNNNGGCSHECINSYNQVFCLCPEGMLLGSDWKTCQDVDECSEKTLDCPHLCINTIGSAHCQCHPGYQGLDGKDCLDIDECLLEDNGGCSHDCLNTEGSFECQCQDGFELLADEKTCLDLDECEEDNGGCQHFCFNEPGTRSCGCKSGYNLSPDDNSTCIDEDECSLTEGICQHGDCINLPGTFKCQCHLGFKLNSGLCVDIDECSFNNEVDVEHVSICGQFGECVNLLGSYECDCDLGFTFSEGTCLDIDECNQTEDNPCGHGICQNLSPGFECECFQGFELVDNTCVDVNECVDENQNPCGQGTCQNTDGAYHCECDPGFEVMDGHCIDINECKADPGLCGHHGDCVNYEGGFSCSCHLGFQLSNDVNVHQCIDINECLNEPCIGGSCVNLPGSYECNCPTGFHIVEKDNCGDIDECEVANGGCHHKCVNLQGSFQCQCNNGFQVNVTNEFDCHDIDECVDGDNGGCEQLCINVQGGHRCDCQPGFSKNLEDHKSCLDLDECQSNNGGCQHVCSNTPGSFLCSCMDGFRPSRFDSLSCDDIDECLSGNGGCSHLCLNTDGGYKCKCPPDHLMQPDEKTCLPDPKEIPCKSATRPQNGHLRCNSKKVNGFFDVGTKCKLKCNRGYVPVIESGKRCMPNGQWAGPEAECQPLSCPNIDPVPNSRVSPTSCLAGDQPIGTKCSFECDSGYKLTGKKTNTCSRAQTWKHPFPSCAAEFPLPFIMCPADISKSLGGTSTSLYVMFPQPKTNVDWFRYIDSEPSWAKQLEGEMTRGKHVITFRARSPVSNQSASCQFIVHIKDTEPPRVKHCPISFSATLPHGENVVRVTWKEPIFTDNVKVNNVMASFLPGHYFSVGQHNVLYQAADADGNKAKCGFTINVVPANGRSPPKSDSPRPNGNGKNYLPSPLAPVGMNNDDLEEVSAVGSSADECARVPEVENGRMACNPLPNGGKKCTPVCKAEHDFYQKFNGRPPTYLCMKNRVDWKIRKFIPDCSPVHEMRNGRTCEAGWEAREDGRKCVACPPGMYRGEEDHLCQLCPKARYSDQFGSSRCIRCPVSHTTRGLGSRNSSACFYMDSIGSSLVDRRKGRKESLGLMYYNRWMSNRAAVTSQG